MHRTLLALVLVLALPAAAQDRFASTTADVTAWNLAGFNAIPRDRATRFARVIANMDPEVIGLVELNPDRMAAEVVAELNELGPCYPRKILDQSANQNVAILHKCEVEVSNPRFIAGSDLGRSGLREALVADVRMGDFDFLLLVLHLKASRSASDRTDRTNQNQIIAAFLANEPELDVVVVGDFNMIPGEDDANFDAMAPNNELRFLAREDFPTQGTHITSGGIGNHLDGYAVANPDTAEYVEGSLRVIEAHRDLGLSVTEFRSQVADHLPLMARFRIGEDDD